MARIIASAIIKKSGIKFGTSGARGLASQFTSEVCSAFSVAFIDVMGGSFEFDRVAVGIDLRPSSPAMVSACIKAIERSGLSVDYCGVIPTPALAHYAMSRNIPALMVTGSHIPFDRNGMKFYRPDGEISKNDEVKIASSDAIIPMLATTDNNLPQVVKSAASFYVERYISCFDINMLSACRIGLYEHSSAAREVFGEILRRLGAEVISLGRTDEFIPIDTEAVSDDDRKRGVDWASEYGLDCIISTDGDGDRPMVSDENGVWLPGDTLGLLCASYLSINSLAIPVSCNSSIERSRAFSEVVRTRIGSPYVIEGMKGLAHFDTVAGFEANGGFLLSKNVVINSKELTALPTRDAVLPALAVLADSRRQRKTLSKLVSELPQRYTASDRLKDFSHGESESLLNKLNKDHNLILEYSGLDGCKVDGMNDIDGLRFSLSNSQIIHLRPSGNAPELRCYCEAESYAVAHTLVDTVLRCIRNMETVNKSV